MFCDITVAVYWEDNFLPLGKIDLPFLKTLRVEEKTHRQMPSGVSSILDLFYAPSLSTLEIPRSFLQSCLSDFLKRMPSIQELFLFHLGNEESITKIMELLRNCPSLSVLTLQPQKWAWGGKPFDANKFLQEFVDDAVVGEVICPHLRSFELIGRINFSLHTLHQFLEAKHCAIPTPNGLTPWQSMFIDTSAICGSETYQQMLDLVSQHQAMGLDIQTRRSAVRFSFIL